MSQSIRTLGERTVHGSRQRATITTTFSRGSSTVLPAIIIGEAGGTYSVAIQEADGEPSDVLTFVGILPLLPGGTFEVGNPVALLFQANEPVPSILATGGGTSFEGSAVYVVFGGLGFAS